MNGPYPLNAQTIGRVVPGLSVGAYILSKDGKIAHYVGRSDSNLVARLASHTSDSQNYTQFWYEVTGSAKFAFELECSWWHKYQPDDNQNHPDRPDGSNWQCSVCNVFKVENRWY